jgi:hypothetical protein
MKTSNGMKGRNGDEQALLGKREFGGPVVVVVVVGPARKKASASQITDARTN